MNKTRYASSLRLGQRIRKLRKEKGFTQDWLAHAVGVSHDQLSVLENGRQKKIDISVLERIAFVLGRENKFLM